MPEAVYLRAGGAEDVDAAVAGWREAQLARRDAEAPPTQDARVAGYLAQTDNFFVVAESGRQLVGMALGMQALEDDGTGPPIAGLCHVSMVYVRPSHWGHGIAKLLMRDLEAEGRRRGYKAFQLWTQADNDRARRLYEGLGFRLSGREKDDDTGERIVHYQLCVTGPSLPRTG